MILILLAIICSIVASVFLLQYADKSYDFFPGVAGVMLAIVAGISSVIYAGVGFQWFASGYRVEIINREYGTSYTQEELFWASDVIDTVRELDRRRIELNGDLMREDEGKRAQP